MHNKKISGNKGEDTAARYLKKKKYKIVERNINTKAGEIDIIAMQGSVYVFVEVKYRATAIYGMGFEAVDFRKQDKIRRSAILYCQAKQIKALCRFDVVSIDGEQITHIENAF
ncbi:MAG: YraN family protein [Deferribacteraceae bacterium]|jgi:putative endonuclease|nr:YraN family protein [Deferribacteraceae bacterium]